MGFDFFKKNSENRNSIEIRILKIEIRLKKGILKIEIRLKKGILRIGIQIKYQTKIGFNTLLNIRNKDYV